MTAICLIVRNEARDMPGWFAHHAAIGFDEFVVFDHASDDGTVEVLERMARIYNVKILPAPTDKHRQITAYNHALTLVRSEWCAFLDADEYLMCVTGSTVQPWLADMSRAIGGILLNWAIFGSSGYVDPPDDLVPRAYTRRAPLDAGINQFFKSIVRVNHTVYCRNPHLFTVFGDLVDAGGNPVSIRTDTCQTVGPIPNVPWRVNHYALRSRSDYDRRVARGSLSGTPYAAERWRLWDRNDEEDLSAKTFYGARWQHELARPERTIASRLREFAGSLP